jgi:hypothetical protein
VIPSAIIFIDISQAFAVKILYHPRYFVGNFVSASRNCFFIQISNSVISPARNSLFSTKVDTSWQGKPQELLFAVLFPKENYYMAGSCSLLYKDFI